MSSQTPKWLQTLITWFPTGIGGGATVHFVMKDEWKQAIISSAITAGLSLWAKFSTGFMERLEEGVNERGRKTADLLLKATDSLPEQLKWKFSNFEFKYCQSLIYDCRYHQTKGLKTKAPFKLNLEKVFVPLRVAPESPGQISAEIIQNRERNEGIKIWDFLTASRSEDAYRSIVIIGAPGSGKTTLLEHLTLVYAQNEQRKYDRKAPKLMPILLYLRNVAETISSSQPTLAALLEQQESAWFKNSRFWVTKQQESSHLFDDHKHNTMNRN